MVQRMSENDKIVTRYMDDKEFGDAPFPLYRRQFTTAFRWRTRTLEDAARTLNRGTARLVPDGRAFPTEPAISQLSTTYGGSRS